MLACHAPSRLGIATAAPSAPVVLLLVSYPTRASGQIIVPNHVRRVCCCLRQPACMPPCPALSLGCNCNACLMPASLFAFSDLETKPCGRPVGAVVTHGMGRNQYPILYPLPLGPSHGPRQQEASTLVHLFVLGESGTDDDKNAAWHGFAEFSGSVG